MQNLVRSKTVGPTGNGGRGTAGAGPGRDLLYGSRGVPAPYRRNGDSGPHEPCPRTPWVQIVESVESTPDWEAREERRCSERRALAGHGLVMEDLTSPLLRGWVAMVYVVPSHNAGGAKGSTSPLFVFSSR